MIEPYHGFGGPWRGSYFTCMEGSLRVAFLLRWPGHVPAGSVSNEIIHEMDLFPTLARIVGGKVPGDRIIDGVDQLDFLTGKQERSNRDSVIIYVGDELYGVKWRNWKMLTKFVSAGFFEPVKQYGVPLFFDLLADPKEEYPSDARMLRTCGCAFLCLRF
jgi:arylsulfatase A-like enzyme